MEQTLISKQCIDKWSLNVKYSLGRLMELTLVAEYVVLPNEMGSGLFTEK